MVTGALFEIELLKKGKLTRISPEQAVFLMGYESSELRNFKQQFDVIDKIGRRNIETVNEFYSSRLDEVVDW